MPICKVLQDTKELPPPGGQAAGPGGRKGHGEFNLDPWVDPLGKFKAEYKGYTVPEVDKWRLGLLEQLLEHRRDMLACGDDVTEVRSLIDSLCSS